MFITTSSIHDILISMAITIILGFILFYFKLCGAGDCKLIIGFSPLFIPSIISDFFIFTLACGGVVSLFIYVKYKLLFSCYIKRDVPYGVAIVFGAHLTLYFYQGLEIYS
ncbi:hypothetical protein VHA01S_004_01070 [Vibrio halioticoli NBRC 102217]|uniref:Prepilin type IV endopeptidase peptidase domain-containing protein n=2 Tax=Vibrio halioticoli TaxID=71388 RepID=V5EZS6_9VIBR|nr:hypothetical protein VHA01S_004_01070 [Vibrio halioticoli NBRC 102217]